MATEEKPPLQNPRVFINFRGVELRQSFIAHLKMALKRGGVNVYVQAEQPMGGVSPKLLFKGIEESSIALVIFTERYTESSWCLDELVRIKERVEQSKLKLITVYYKVPPSTVGRLDGYFGLNMWNHVKHTSDFDKLKKWKEALDFVLQKRGLMFREKSSELEFVRAIVDVVLDKVDRVLAEVKFPREIKKGDDFRGEANPNESKSSIMVTHDVYPPRHQVYINFRGAELRNGFVSHLSSGLQREGVNVYIDDIETWGQDLEILLSRIEDSKIALVIFSRRYTESSWCLDELLKIKELMDEGKLIAIPIFYHVEQWQVTELKGEFGDNFWNMWRINRDHSIIKWKEALKSVAARKGFYLQEHSPQSEFITLIVKKVLEYISEREGDNPSLFPSPEKRKSAVFPTGEGETDETYLNTCYTVGIEQCMEQLENKLEFDCSDTRIIGVVGMPGIGKTTLAKMLYKKWNGRFIRCVPLMDIRKKSEGYGLVWLRKTFLEVLLEGTCQEISDETTHGSVKVELLNTKIFAVLDDVSDKKQLEFLLGDLDWIKMGSRIIITTCDKSLLEGFAHDTYVVPELNNREAFQLFSYHAFSDWIRSPTDTLLMQSRKFVDYARGHPLALTILGMVLGKDGAHWEYKLEMVTKIVQNIWRCFIDQLNEKQKDVFLDIVYFFQSENEYFVRSLLDSGDPDASVSEVKDLVNKFLVTLSDGRVEINVPLYSLGMDFGSGRWLRLCNYEEIMDALKTMEISEANNIRGIFLNMSTFKKSINLNSLTFSNMHNLRYLKIYDSSCPAQCEVDCKLCILDGLEFPLKEVRYLHWVQFPLEELPPDFRPEKLVDLRLPYSKIERVWEGVKDTPRLKWVDLSHSRKLLDVSALSKAENLLRLNLEGCTSLDELPVEIKSMKSLVFLNLRGCLRLRSLPKMNLISLKILILSGCTNLKKFQLISESLEILHLDGTALEELPSAIKKLQRLVLLNLKNCKVLKCLPKCLGELKSLEELILSGCSRLKNLSDVRDCMKHLQSLLIDRIGAKEMPNISPVAISEGQASADMILQPFQLRKWPRGVNGVCSLTRLCLSGNDFVSLQTDIGKLYNLNWLDVKECKMLTSIPILPPRLQYFDAHGCDSLQTVAHPLAHPVLSEQVHARFYFSNCYKLDQDAKDRIISYTRCKSQLGLDAVCRYNQVSILERFSEICFPGRDIPAWFSHQASGPVLNPKLPPHWCDNKFTGFGLCAVILFPVNYEKVNQVLVKCNYEFPNKDGSCIRYSCTVGGWSEPCNTPRKIESSHVFIGFTSRLDIKEHSEDDNEEKCSDVESSFEFLVTDGTKVIEGCEVLKCGLYLVYATDERENLSWDAKTVVAEEKIENIPSEERSARNSVGHNILYKSDSGLVIGRDEMLFNEGTSDASLSIQKTIENC